ncbi:MAG: hypothetical protein P1U63_10170 [Coxiellaceae bacterium]|nr:hypothetical protein [Coxiellaceae bacterium]
MFRLCRKNDPYKGISSAELRRPLIDQEAKEAHPAAPVRIKTADALAAAGIDSYTFANVYFFLNEDLDASFRTRDTSVIRKYSKETLLLNIYRSIKDLLKVPSAISKEDACDVIALRYLQTHALITMDYNNVLQQAKDQPKATATAPRGSLSVEFKLRFYSNLLNTMETSLSAHSVSESNRIRRILTDIYGSAEESTSDFESSFTL